MIQKVQSKICLPLKKIISICLQLIKISIVPTDKENETKHKHWYCNKKIVNILKKIIIIVKKKCWQMVGAHFFSFISFRKFFFLCCIRTFFLNSYYIDSPWPSADQWGSWWSPERTRRSWSVVWIVLPVRGLVASYFIESNKMIEIWLFK